MRLNYDAETDSLYIDLAAAPSSEFQEIADGLVVDYDDRGRVVGIDIQHASEFVDLSAIEMAHLPIVAKIA